MAKTPGHPLSPLTEDGGLVVGGVLDHVMDASTVEMPPPPPLPRSLPLTQIVPVPLIYPPLPLILSLCNPYLQRRPPGKRPMTRSHATGDKADCNEITWFEDNYGVKRNINDPHPFHKLLLRTTIGSKITPGCE